MLISSALLLEVTTQPICLVEMEISCFDHVPDEIIVHILSFVSTSDLCGSVSRLSQKFQRLVYTCSLWIGAEIRLPQLPTTLRLYLHEGTRNLAIDATQYSSTLSTPDMLKKLESSCPNLTRLTVRGPEITISYTALVLDERENNSLWSDADVYIDCKDNVNRDFFIFFLSHVLDQYLLDGTRNITIVQSSFLRKPSLPLSLLDNLGVRCPKFTRLIVKNRKSGGRRANTFPCPDTNKELIWIDKLGIPWVRLTQINNKRLFKKQCWIHYNFQESK
jgi:hypothetical protein